ncbi:MAG: carboxylating nicotinate-nucleotide diphosphorylase [Methanocorpusculum sp.]|nr:carboxylating nicotinate-nucleotide diphosphorylase [Methanocorpusculum sp.]
MDSHELLLSFLAEDAVSDDITTKALLENKTACARIEAREDMVVSGIDECIFLFGSAGVDSEVFVEDGTPVKAGTMLLRLKGPVHGILSVERTALNLLGRMSGIASAASRAQRLAGIVNDHVKVAGTRKTAPGLRFFDKKAIAAGGALPHRYDLSDAFLIKDTHRNFLPVDEAVRRCKVSAPDKTVECEVESVEDAISAARAGADVVMFDNMGPDAIRSAVYAISAARLREKVKLEISGGVRPEKFPEYAGIDVDIISMGSLTHSVRCADVSLEIESCGE